MPTLLDDNGKITIHFVKTKDAPDADEETLIFWFFKVLRQFGLEAEIETETDTYTEETINREL